MSVPALREPTPQAPGAQQKTISELLTQWANLTGAAIVAIGQGEGWYRGQIQEHKPWDPAAEDVTLFDQGIGQRSPGGRRREASRVRA